MPYTPEHKANTRARIVAAARRLFNRRGFTEVSIDEIMGEAGLTRGGFYNHFRRKEDLYAEAITHVLTCGLADGGRIATMHADHLIAGYLSDQHLTSLDTLCPLIAYPTDVARGNESVKLAYRQVLSGLIGVLQRSLGDDDEARTQAVTIATLCVGGMLIARAVDDAELGREIREAAMKQAQGLAGRPPDLQTAA